MCVYVASVHYNGIDRFGKGAGGVGGLRILLPLFPLVAKIPSGSF